MSRKDYYEIGAIMTRKSGKKYDVVESLGCYKCSFDKKGFLWCDGMLCDESDRKDGTPINFIRRKDLEE